MYKLQNWGFLQNGEFFPLNNDYILEDSGDFFYPMAQMFMRTIQTSSSGDMFTCSDEVQPSTALFYIASQQLRHTEVNIHPTEIVIPLHSTLVFPPSKIFILFNSWKYRNNSSRPSYLVSDEEISETNNSKTGNSQNIARATKSWMEA